MTISSIIAEITHARDAMRADQSVAAFRRYDDAVDALVQFRPESRDELRAYARFALARLLEEQAEIAADGADYVGPLDENVRVWRAALEHAIDA